MRAGVVVCVKNQDDSYVERLREERAPLRQNMLKPSSPVLSEYI